MHMYNQRISKLIGVIFVVILIAVSVFVFLKGFFQSAQSTYTQEILSACLGTMMVAVITTILLKAQSSTEVQRDKSLGIFQHKLHLYSSFLDFVYDMIQDGRIEQSELNALAKWLTRIALVADALTLMEVTHFVDQCCEYKKFKYEDLSEKERAHWHAHRTIEDDGDEITKDDFVSVGMVVSALRLDIGETTVSGDLEIATCREYIDSMVDRIGSETINQSGTVTMP